MYTVYCILYMCILYRLIHDETSKLLSEYITVINTHEHTNHDGDCGHKKYEMSESAAQSSLNGGIRLSHWKRQDCCIFD